jgi:dienelactone hydrolase
MRTVLALLLFASLLAPTSALASPSDGVEAGTSEWVAREAANRAAAYGRSVDQATNVDYLARQAAVLDTCVEEFHDRCTYTDPYRLDWGATRGESLAVSWRNRYGVDISGHLWAPRTPWTDPVTGRAGSGPFPAVVVVNGAGAIEEAYWGLAQSLAESGYVVLTFNPQCIAPSGCDPEPRFCDPSGWWREQEMGLRENGRCAGQAAATNRTPDEQAAEDVAFGVFAAGCIAHGECDNRVVEERYRDDQAIYALGAIDAVTWLLSADNPWRARVDQRRIAAAGHSMGAHGAAVAANGDPLRRFSAAVSWDGYGLSAEQVPPRVPTMFQRADHAEYGTKLAPPDIDGTPRRNTLAFAAAGVDTAHVALAASTHQEWAYTPLYGPAIAGQFTASRHGERVALYYTLAWFDRYVKGRDAAMPATARLFADAFDTSADVSSIGQGAWDPVQRRNLPYMIDQRLVADHLSFYHPSFARLRERSCDDLRVGCAR